MSTEQKRPPGLSAADLTALRERLQAERDRVRGLMRGIDTEYKDSEASSDEPRDYGEMGRDIMQEDTAMALADEEEQLLAQIEHALERMAQGTYGWSEVSGKPIPLERLQALPWATTTVDDPAELPR